MNLPFQDRKMTIVLILLVVQSLIARGNGDEQNFEFVCEHETLVLSCNSDEYLETTDALYGYDWNDTDPRTTCTLPAYLKIKEGQLCRATGSIQIASGICNGNVNCTVAASNRVFGDPCVGTFKYLRVNYTCLSNSTTPVPPDSSSRATTAVGKVTTSPSKDAVVLWPLATLISLPLLLCVVVYGVIKMRAKYSTPEAELTTKQHQSANYYASNKGVSVNSLNKENVNLETSEPVYETTDNYEIPKPVTSEYVDVNIQSDHDYEGYYLSLDGTQLSQGNVNEYSCIHQSVEI